MLRALSTSLLLILTQSVLAQAAELPASPWRAISGGETEMGGLPVEATLESSGAALRLKLAPKGHPELAGIYNLQASLHDAYGHSYYSPASNDQPFDLSVIQSLSGSLQAEITPSSAPTSVVELRSAR